MNRGNDMEVSMRRIPQVIQSLVAMAVVVGGFGCGEKLMPTPNILVATGETPWRETPAEFKTHTADVYYATDRLPENGADQPPEYGGRRFDRLAYGVCTVDLGGGDWKGLVRESTRRRRSRAMPVRVTRVREVGRFPATPWPFEVINGQVARSPKARQDHDAAEQAFRSWVAARLEQTGKKEVYVYIHGVSNAFDESAADIAQFWHFMGRQGVPMVYSWPTGSSVAIRDYNRDRESGDFTVYHLKQFLLALAGTPNLRKVHLLAHSRGTEVLSDALRELNIQCLAANPDGNPAADLRIGNLVLVAADIDIEVARQRLAAEGIGRICERLTVYSSPDDLALKISRWLVRGTVRLGTLGLVKMQSRDRRALATLQGVDFIDARVRGDFIGHSYFYSNPAVSSDLILLLRDDRPPGAAHGRPLERKSDVFWELRDGYPEVVTSTSQPTIVETTRIPIEDGLAATP